MSMMEINKNDKISFKSLVKRFFARPDSSGIVAVTLLVLIFATVTENFLLPVNIYNVLRNAALFVFIATPQVMVLIIGDMNLSSGSIGGLSVVLVGELALMGMNIWLAVLLVLILGCLLGGFNALIITKLKLNSFVATLSTSFIFTGLVYGISEGQPYADIPSEITTIGRGSFLGLPMLFYMMVLLLFAMAIFFKYILTGRRILATGGNKEAARLSGIRTDQITVLCNVLSGLFSALAGVLFISRLGSASPTIGLDWMVTAFAVAIIGGTALKGGIVSATGLFFSGILMAIIKNGLVMMEVNNYFEQTFLGIIILISVVMESIRRKYTGEGSM
jgi:ribose transport system permease protein